MFIIIFVVFHSIGKFIGIVVGGKISKASSDIQKFTVGALIFQGGIVIGLALAIKGKFALEKAGEITFIKK